MRRHPLRSPTSLKRERDYAASRPLSVPQNVGEEGTGIYAEKPPVLLLYPPPFELRSGHFIRQADRKVKKTLNSPHLRCLLLHRARNLKLCSLVCVPVKQAKKFHQISLLAYISFIGLPLHAKIFISLQIQYIQLT